MDICLITRFLGWCCLINFGLLFFSFFMICFFGDFIFKVHGKWFKLPREKFDATIYSMLGGYKILIIFFNLVPYIVLKMIIK
ncbi:MAG: hypothetical protein PHV17_09065 [Candidatus Omnitrophica bacterium]|nr:hypothetical protein [Candidatus Omnitrophota bacterium]